jgi:transposase
VHDGFKSYAANSCQHALCNAHHLRELTFVAEQLGQGWAEKLKSLLCELKARVEQSQALGLSQLEQAQLVEYELNYFKLLYEGLLANPPPALPPLKKRGKPKQSKARNLLDRLFFGQKQVFAFAYNFKVPFDNNQAERDLRMVKVQQKVSGCFRSADGATFFCRIRSYLSSIRKQGQSVLLALLETFCGKTFLPPSLA